MNRIVVTKRNLSWVRLYPTSSVQVAVQWKVLTNFEPLNFDFCFVCFRMLATPNTLNFKMLWKAKLQSPRKRDLSSTLLPSLKNPSRLYLKRKARWPRDPLPGDPSGLHTRLKISVPLRGSLEEVRRSGVKKKKWGRAGNWHIAIFSSVVIISWYVL